jgi:hypothetical protein
MTTEQLEKSLTRYLLLRQKGLQIFDYEIIKFHKDMGISNKDILKSFRKIKQDLRIF